MPTLILPEHTKLATQGRQLHGYRSSVLGVGLFCKMAQGNQSLSGLIWMFRELMGAAGQLAVTRPHSSDEMKNSPAFGHLLVNSGRAVPAASGRQARTILLVTNACPNLSEAGKGQAADELLKTFLKNKNHPLCPRVCSS